MRRCIDDVDEDPNSASPERKELRDGQAGISQVEPVDTEIADEDREKKRRQPVFFREHAWNLANGKCVAGCGFNDHVR